MKLPLSWLKEYVALPPLPQLIERMNQTGTTVEAVTPFGEGLAGIVVGEILAVNPHPNADKLQLATVQLPGKKLEIVCGARNIEVGQKVPVAPVGSSVPVGPNGVAMPITRAEIRGIKSSGMLCSAKELGLGEDHAGILILDPSIKIGTKLTTVLSLPETILETEVTTNRGDELSIYGTARELGAILDVKLKPLPTTKLSVETNEILPLSVKVAGNDLASRYSAVVVTGIKLGPAPALIQTRLRESGIRPINNVVDITNYIMLLTGQPLHAFDYNKVANHLITVRESKSGDRVVTLDGQLRQLGFGNIVITDSEKILGLAGVMGGEDESVTDLTDTIVLESAVFNPKMIRATAMKYSLQSEAALRFQRGVDPTKCLTALAAAVKLLQLYAGGIVANDIVDIYPHPQLPVKVGLTQAKLDRYLGYRFPLSQAATILAKLGFTKVTSSAEELTVAVPSWRATDIAIEEDLIEEVARISGYDKIPEQLPSGVIAPLPPNPAIEMVRQAKEHLSALGYSEVLTYSLVPETLVNAESTLKLANTISKEWEYLRTSLIPGLAQAAMTNINWSGEFRVFELSKVYLPREHDLPAEPNHLGLVGEDFYEVKGVIESLLTKLNLPGRSYTAGESEYLTEVANIMVDNNLLGQIGTLNHVYRERTGLKRGLWFAELDFDAVLTHRQTNLSFPEIPRFPMVKVDLSILVNLDVPIGQIMQTVASAKSELLASTEPFDVFTDPKLGEHKKSVSLRLFFQSKDKTLTDAEVKIEREKIEQVLKQNLKAKIR